MDKKLIGREQEIAQLDKCMTSDKSELVVLYGRRRVGKTFLVRNYFNNSFTFTYTGVKGFTKTQQLSNFAKALQLYGNLAERPALVDWIGAFDMLEQVLMRANSDGKKVIFLDEMPWIDTQKSDFVSALENFWNGWAAHQGDIVLIACGSATSWIVDKLLHNKGGLFNRTTRHIYLRPFNLAEVEEYLDYYGFGWDRYQIAQCYMILGGIPFYLTMLDASMSLAQNIDALFFAGVNASLRMEYDELFASLFNNPEGYISVVKALSQHREGLTRTQISELTSISGERLTTILRDLDRCDFTFSYMRFGNKRNNVIYRIKDFYSLFFYRFVDGHNINETSYWSQLQGTPEVVAWQGLSFELLCLLHIEAIKRRLGINVIRTNVTTWRSKSRDSNSQIDLVIERADRIINLCEMKFSGDVYNITKAYAQRLLERKSQFVAETATRCSTQLTMVTTFGILIGKNSAIVNSQVVLDDLFEMRES
ncbi:MAG: ATP-binding protein [Muribaculaceae bacterium]|nr:ATP-binding protein [Muribaculaceae bacterium]